MCLIDNWLTFLDRIKFDIDVCAYALPRINFYLVSLLIVGNTC